MIGGSGSHRLRDGTIEGTDPLAPYGDHAPWAVLRCTSMPTAPDIYVNSVVSPSTLEVAAFEHLVGSHGGLGGWQSHPFALVPSGWSEAEKPIVGVRAMHEAIRRWLTETGLELKPHSRD